MSEVEIQVSRLVFLALCVTLLDKLKTSLKPLMIRSREERVRVKICTLT